MLTSVWLTHSLKGNDYFGGTYYVVFFIS